MIVLLQSALQRQKMNMIFVYVHNSEGFGGHTVR